MRCRSNRPGNSRSRRVLTIMSLLSSEVRSPPARTSAPNRKEGDPKARDTSLATSLGGWGGDLLPNDLVHSWRRAVVDLFRASPITRACRPGELSAGDEANRV